MISPNALTPYLVLLCQLAEQFTVRSGLPDLLREVRGFVIDPAGSGVPGTDRVGCDRAMRATVTLRVVRVVHNWLRDGVRDVLPLQLRCLSVISRTWLYCRSSASAGRAPGLRRA